MKLPILTHIPTIAEIRLKYPQLLDSRFGPRERDVDDLLIHLLKKDEAFLLAHPEKKLSPLQYSRFQLMFMKRHDGFPLQYIFHETNFDGLNIKVNKFVLIPRPDTELLVQKVEEYVKVHPIRNIADIGTGSGAIIIALAKKLDKDYFFIGTDISVAALNLARLNGLRNKVNVHFYLRDFIKKPYTFLPLTSWVLVSNPPYLTETELSEPSIQYEPKLALYGGPDGLDAYRTMLEQVSNLENKPKAIFFEIGWKQAEAIKKLAKENFKIRGFEVFQDSCGRDRVVKIEL